MNLYTSNSVITSMGLVCINKLKSTKLLDKEFTNKKRYCNNQKD